MQRQRHLQDTDDDSDDDEAPAAAVSDAPLIVEHQEQGTEAEEEEEALAVPGGGLATGSQASKKTPRKLPSFMIRPTPTGRNGFIYENFRIFIKWTLDVISSNPAISNVDTLEAVYVNLPAEYDFLYDAINENVADHKIQFLPITTSQVQQNIRDNLELFGGFYAKQVNKVNNFHHNQFEAVKKAPEKKKSEVGDEKPSGNPITARLLKAIESLSGKKPDDGEL